MKKVVQKFNVLLGGKTLVVFEETKNGEGAKYHENLKTLITDKHCIIEPKGVDPYRTENYANFVMLTNEYYPVKLTVNDRRFFCLDADGKHKNDPKYWTNLLKQLNPDMGRRLYLHLAQYDLDNWNHREMPKTTLQQELKVANLHQSVRYLIELYKLKGPKFDEQENLKIHSETLFAEYKRWETALEGKIALSSQMLCAKKNHT